MAMKIVVMERKKGFLGFLLRRWAGIPKAVE